MHNDERTARLAGRVILGCRQCGNIQWRVKAPTADETGPVVVVMVCRQCGEMAPLDYSLGLPSSQVLCAAG
jgi:ribosomal protein L40E